MKNTLPRYQWRAVEYSNTFDCPQCGRKTYDGQKVVGWIPGEKPAVVFECSCGEKYSHHAGDYDMTRFWESARTFQRVYERSLKND